MSFAGKVWRLLVGIKDGMVLLFMLLFFVALFSLLSARPSPGQIREGALLIELDGSVVEESSRTDPPQSLISRQLPAGEFPTRDPVPAPEAAATTKRIQAVVVNLIASVGGHGKGV